jgi:hypothetical protein
VFELIHSYKHKQEECILCGKKDSINKCLSNPINVLKKASKQQGTKKAGSAVNKAIEENRKNLRKQKKDLKDKR